jgi:hypothetical protein
MFYTTVQRINTGQVIGLCPKNNLLGVVSPIFSVALGVAAQNLTEGRRIVFDPDRPVNERWTLWSDGKPVIIEKGGV